MAKANLGELAGRAVSYSASLCAHSSHARPEAPVYTSQHKQVTRLISHRMPHGLITKPLTFTITLSVTLLQTNWRKAN